MARGRSGREAGAGPLTGLPWGPGTVDVASTWTPRRTERGRAHRTAGDECGLRRGDEPERAGGGHRRREEVRRSRFAGED